MNKMQINTLSCTMLLVPTALMILYPTQASGTEDQIYSNGSSKSLENEDEKTLVANQNLGVEASKLDVAQIDGSNITNSKPKFIRVDNQSAVVNFDFPTFRNDSLISCNIIFKCTTSFSTGWRDDTSFKISTNNTNNKWSPIYGKEMDVKSNKSYELVTHMKLNKWAIQSHVALEAFNETSKQWDQIKRCPSVTNGPLEWQEFSCIITIPQNITKIRPVINAGSSSQQGKEAITWYDSIYVINLGKYFVTDPNLKIELVVSGLKLPTSMAFLAEDDILVLEKDTGMVKRVVNGKVLAKPLIDAPVATKEERGMLGIAISKSEINNRTYVFLYFTESATGIDGDDIAKKKEPLGNRLYRYEYIDGKLLNPKLLLDLPASPWPYHNGGALTIGPDNNTYIVIGDGTVDSQTNNEVNKVLPEGRAGILRVTEDGKPVLNNSILGNKYPLNLYYAYGIRNSFGIDFDPVAGNLWDTENGPSYGDEINLVKAGFNSGWKKVQGLWTVGPWDPVNEEKKGNFTSVEPYNLVNFNGRGKYSSPEFTWNYNVAPTAIKFLTTDKLGEQYKNDMFIADQNTGKIHYFNLNQNRTELVLQGPLADKVVDSNDELDSAVFAKISGHAITDLEVGPDGYLYLVSIWEGTIFRIVPMHLINEGRSLN